MLVLYTLIPSDFHWHISQQVQTGAPLLLFPIRVPTGAQAFWFMLSFLFGYCIVFSFKFFIGLLAFSPR
ncbi:hypothetical protein [Paenibacillus sedimenti]|uniref:Uncharacterized protein n=1 Tax=Paenibacillus sedimenti TaxID=2770274 RepID=A0A926QJU1_9BACL|nr:hypothetical protein [Paenibacillus sedimenti]MBD0381895.1 hypothetical protein [Paenibacillus sedimenti]